MNKLSLRFKTIVLFLLLSLIPLSILSVLSLSNQKNFALDEAREKLNTISDLQANQVGQFLKSMRMVIKTFSTNPNVVDSFVEFNKAFKKYPAEVVGEDKVTEKLSATKKELFKYYELEFNKKFGSLNSNNSAMPDLEKWIDRLSVEAVYLQHDYIYTNSNPLGSKNALINLENKTTYNEVHSKYHGYYNQIVGDYGLYDWFFVNNDGDIIYTVFKELDFSNSLKSPSLSQTKIAETWVKAKDLKEGESYVSDMQEYFPSYSDPAAFIGAPLYSDGKKIGTIIYQLPVSFFEESLTGKYKWSHFGEFQTGDSYIYSKQDSKLRSTLRSYYNDSKKFLDTHAFTSNAEKKLVENTSSLVLNMTTPVKDLEFGKTTLVKCEHGECLSSATDLSSQGLNWVLVNTIEVNEALMNYYSSLKYFFYIFLGIASLISLFAYFFGAKFSGMLSSISKSIDDSLLDSKVKIDYLKAKSDEISASSHEQASAVQETMAAIQEISSMITQTTTNAEDTRKISSDVSLKAVQGKEVLSNLQDSIDKIQQSTDRLSKISDTIGQITEKTKIINDIVLKTQLLSFNASIEAARAGQHGKGFAVVAEEVGKLAQTSGRASSEINELLQDSVKTISDLLHENKSLVSNGKNISVDASNTFSTIIDQVRLIAGSTEDISKACSEQESGIKQTSLAMSEIDKLSHTGSQISLGVKDSTDKLKHCMDSLFTQGSILSKLVSGQKDPNVKKSFLIGLTSFRKGKEVLPEAKEDISEDEDLATIAKMFKDKLNQDRAS
jgi:methyl-accepting chemotaxis protein